MNRRFSPFLLLGLLASGGSSLVAQEQNDPPQEPETQPPEFAVEPLPLPEGAPPEIRDLVGELAQEGVRVDFRNRVVLVEGVILLDRMQSGYPIEYLVVTESGFTHESLAIVRCLPSRLSASFMALGLEPGKTVRFEKKDPPPPVEKIISGEAREYDAMPPEGAVVDISVRWTDEDGEKQHPIEDFIRYLPNGEPLPRRGFVFVGSRFHKVVIGAEREERYMADLEGNVVSLYIAGFGNCLFDMNSTEGAAGFIYDINTDLCPERGTRVTFMFALRS